MTQSYTPALPPAPGPHANGVAALIAGNGLLAVDLLSQAVQEDPADAARRVDLGDALGAVGDFSGAHDAYSAAVALNPDNPLYHFNLGVACQRLGRPRDAASHYAGALALEPLMAIAYFNLATIFQDAGILDVAEQHYRNALEARPDYAEAAANLGLILRRLGRPAEAQTALETAARLLPDSAQAWANLGLLLNETGQYESALDTYDYLNTLTPDDTTAALGRAEALRGLARWDAAVTAVTALLTQPDSPPRAEVEAALLAGSLHRARQGAPLSALLAAWRDARGATPFLSHTLAAVGQAPMPDRVAPACMDTLVDSIANRALDTAAAGQALVDELAPLLARHLGPAQGLLRILDGACGAGVLAPLLRPYAAQLSGVDYSRTHLEQARQRNLYSALAQGDILAALEGATGTLDVVVLAGALDYHGDLGQPLGYAADALAPGGTLFATLEAAEPWDPAVILRDDGRYVHRRDAVETSLAGVGLRVLEIIPLPPRAAPYSLAAAGRLAVVARK